MSAVDRTFECMGTEVRLIVDPCGGAVDARAAADDAERYLRAFDRALSRFRPDSELCRLNAAPGAEVRASTLARALAGAARWAAEASGGLVDSTLLDELERAGYTASRTGVAGIPLAEALAEAPTRAPARPRGSWRWASVMVDDPAGLVVRPPGVRLDSGGVGKGLAADAVLARVAHAGRVLVDCGGDIVVGGVRAGHAPFEVALRHPLTGAEAHRFSVRRGAVATSGLDRRVWRRADGRPAHHLLDPSTGEPAWTGLISATALAPTALAAETLAKTALLSGPAGGRRVLAAHGGALIDDAGDVHLVASPRPVTLAPRPAGLAGAR